VDVSRPHPAVYVVGLQETQADRSNLGLANADPSSATTLRVEVFRGADGKATTLPDITLPPGGWAQINSVLNRVGASHGYARVERVAGSGSFVAYGVVNDNMTGDGAYLEGRWAVWEDPPYRPDWYGLPVATDSAVTTTEVSFVNYAFDPGGVRGALLCYQESLADSPKERVSVIRPVGRGEQLVIPNVFDDLRALGGLGPAHARAGRLQCSLSCPFGCGDVASTLSVGRVLTRAQAGAGRYAVSIPVMEEAAHRSAWVLGLRHDLSVRSNLGLTNPDYGNPSPVGLSVDVFDGETGILAGTLDLPLLPPGGWTQVNSVLGRFGVAQGYVRIRALTPGPFYAYGVINDGASPGEGTGDASFVPMTIEE
jgi:hypothetical protein